MITKYTLIIAFLQRTPITINGHKLDVINKIEHENGSGKSFNVTGMNNGKSITIYVKTVD